MTKSIFNGAGYFMNDDRASGGALDEDDIIGCRHCPTPMKKREWKLDGGMCFVCSGPLCVSCTKRAQQFGCQGPEIKRIEQAVNDLHRREQNAKVLGI